MERPASLKTTLLHPLLLLGVLWAPALLVPAHTFAQSLPGERVLVLVTSAESPLAAPESEQIRDAWMGLPVKINDHMLKPLRNLAQPMADEVFLQKVMFMARRRYERNVLSQVFRFGGTRPQRIEDREELEQMLGDNPRSITYMWADAAGTPAGVKILAELWRGTID